MLLAQRASSSDMLLLQGKQIVEGLNARIGTLEYELRTCNEEKEASGSKYADEILRLRRSLEEANNRAKLAEREMTMLQTRLREAPGGSERAKMLEKQLGDKEEHAEALDLEVSRLRGEMKQLDAELGSERQRINERETVIAEQQERLTKQDSERHDLAKMLEAERENVANASQQHDKLRGNHASLQKQYDEQATLAKELTLQRQTLSSSVEIASSETTKLARRVTDLQTKTEGLQTDNRQLLSQLNELRQKVVDVSDERANLLGDLESAHSQISALSKRLVDADAKSSKLSDQLEGVDDQVAQRVADQMRVMEEEAAEHWAEAERLQGVVNAREQEIAALNAEIDSLRSDGPGPAINPMSPGFEEDPEFAPARERIRALQDHHTIELSQLQSRLRSLQTQLFTEQTKSNGLERKVQQMQTEIQRLTQKPLGHNRTISQAVPGPARKRPSGHRRTLSEIALAARMENENPSSRRLYSSIQMGGCPGCIGQVIVL